MISPHPERVAASDASAADACAKIDAGADLVQIYTGLIYRGPALVREAALALARNARQPAAAGRA